MYNSNSKSIKHTISPLKSVHKKKGGRIGKRRVYFLLTLLKNSSISFLQIANVNKTQIASLGKSLKRIALGGQALPST